MTRLTRRELAGCSLATGTASSQVRRSRQPNIILVMTDDQGYGDLACHGNPVIRTPNLDKLRSESVYFTDFHASTLCAPTRAALMTGRYPERVGAWATIGGRNFVRRGERTMAEILTAAGYRTGLFGKWHLGDNYPYRPHDRGFQDVVMHGSGAVGHAGDFWGNDYFDDTYFRNGTPESFQGYCTDVFFREALRFIEANRTSPFFLYLPTNAPHGPFRAPAQYAQPYLDQRLSPPLAHFYGMVTNIDDNMGKLRERLGELDLTRDTILIWLTDNGTGGGMRPGAGFQGFNAGMRGTKRSPYEGGHRVPCFLHWPAGGFSKAREVKELAAHIDLLPTLMDLAGIPKSSGAPFDGVSLAPLLRGRGAIPPRNLALPTPAGPVNGKWTAMEKPVPWRDSAVLSDRWRLIDGERLYDLRGDPAQTRDLAAANPSLVADLRKAYLAWFDDVMRRSDEYPPIVIGNAAVEPVRLTCHDWHGDGVIFSQDIIRELPVANGFWAIEVARAGVYEITLRHFPAEEDIPIRAANARVRCGSVEKSVVVTPGAVEVRFQVQLEAGATRLQSWLHETNGVSRGAFYAYVRRTGVRAANHRKPAILGAQ